MCLIVEQAWRKIMETAEGLELARACYYEHDILAACARFEKSVEWQAVARLVGSGGSPGRQALDLGAGNGIASYALARMGFPVTAVEPDPSDLVGYGALLCMLSATGLPIRHVDALGETLPFDRRQFDLVYARQVLHHARDLTAMLREITRVLKPGGRLIACREHVVDGEESLNRFLASHPVHRFTGGEGAFSVDEYTSAMQSAGLKVDKVIGPWDSPINFYPIQTEALKADIRRKYTARWGRIGQLVTHVPGWERRYLARKSRLDCTPGRLYSFVAVA